MFTFFVIHQVWWSENLHTDVCINGIVLGYCFEMFSFSLGSQICIHILREKQIYCLAFLVQTKTSFSGKMLCPIFFENGVCS